MKTPPAKSKVKTFNQKIKDGDLFTLTRAAEITGYSARHLSRLCAAKAVPHTRRLGGQYLFTLAQIEGVFQVVAPTTPPTQGTRA